VDCHATLQGCHATEGRISHPDVLHCGNSIRLMSLVGQNPNPPFLGLCQLPPAADIVMPVQGLSDILTCAGNRLLISPFWHSAAS
jgi:hypothetical protein